MQMPAPVPGLQYLKGGMRLRTAHATDCRLPRAKSGPIQSTGHASVNGYLAKSFCGSIAVLAVAGCSIYPAYPGVDEGKYGRCRLEADKAFHEHLRGDIDTAAWATTYAVESFEACMKK